MGKKGKLLLHFILPLIIIFLLFGFGTLPGLVGIAAYMAIVLFRSRVSLYTFMGSFKYSRGDLSKGLAWFERAYKTGKAKPKAIASYAYLLLKTGKLEKAEKVLNSVLNAKHEQDDLMYAKSIFALVLWKKGELDNAIAMLQEVIAEYETSAVYGSLGYLLIQKGDMDKALEFNLKACDYNSSNAVILDNLGLTYYLRGEYDKAVEVYEKLMQQRPSFPEAYYNYGLVLQKRGENEKALGTIKKALNYKFSFLSTVTLEEVNTAIDQLEKKA